MKYALIDGRRVHVKEVEKGTIAYDCWFKDYQVKACKGHYMQYWKYTDEKPVLPVGYENETDWHSCWKSIIKDDYCEVICGPNNEHRADILTPKEAIEIQFSSIPFEAAKDRTLFYEALKGKRLIWIVNVYRAFRKKYISTVLRKDGNLNVEWKYRKKWVVDISHFRSSDVYLDISPKANNLLKIWKHEDELLGRWVSKNKFFEDHLKEYSNEIDAFSNLFSVLDAGDYM